MSETPGPRGTEAGPDTETYLLDLHQQLRDARTRIGELEEMVSPPNSIDLADFIGPIKPCPFCGSVALTRDGFEEHIICKNCGASAPVGGWQFRAPIN